MNEIKFRAWDELKHVMHTNFQFIRSGVEGNDWIIFSSDQHNKYDEYIRDPYLQQQLKLMQFSGLCDVNGNEIYKGDIVLVSNDLNQIQTAILKCIVVHDWGSFGARIKNVEQWEHYNCPPPEIGTTLWFLQIFDVKVIEVIGNIYE